MNMVFEVVEVIDPPKEQKDQPEYGKDREGEEDRPSRYLISVKKSRKQKRAVVEETIEEEDLELELESPAVQYNVSIDKDTGF